VSSFQPPPTYALPILIEEQSGIATFNPIWIKWFIDFAKNASSGGAGSVTSVGMSVPTEFNVAGSPVTTTGTLAVSKATQSANRVWAGPASGAAAQPTFRALVAADIPAGGGLVKDTYINEEFTIPLYYQLIVYQSITLIGTASLIIIGTVVII